MQNKCNTDLPFCSTKLAKIQKDNIQVAKGVGKRAFFILSVDM